MSDEFTPEPTDAPIDETMVLPEVTPDSETPVPEEPAAELDAAPEAEFGAEPEAVEFEPAPVFDAYAPAADVVPEADAELATEPDAEPVSDETAALDAAVPEVAPTDDLTDEAIAAAALLAATVPDPAAPAAGAEAATDPAAAEKPAAAAAAPLPAGPGPMVTAGSRVVLVVSTGPAAVAPSAFVEMPDIVGERQGDALSVLQDTGLSVQVFNDYSLTVERGRVMAQRPTLGANVPAGSEVVLLVSSGAAASQTHNVPLPRLTGLPEGEAVTKLQAGGLSPQVVRAPDAVVPAGIVIAQLPDEISLAALPTKRRSATWIWIITAVVLVAAVAGAFFYYQNQPLPVPNVVGLTQAQAQDSIKAAGFKVGSVIPTQTISAAEIGNVVTQTPEPNTEAKRGSGITIAVSGGQALVAIPDVSGKPQADAEKALKDAGFQVSIQESFSASVTVGSVMSQSPTASQKVPINTTIGITISKGAENVSVPGVIGQLQAAAMSALKALGLGAQAVQVPSTTTPKGQVFAQVPTAGTAVAPKTTVGLLVSSGILSSTASTATVPSVVGKSVTDAKKALTNARLVGVTILWSGTGKPNNTVVDQLPDAYTVVGRNSSVILIVSNGK